MRLAIYVMLALNTIKCPKKGGKRDSSQAEFLCWQLTAQVAFAVVSFGWICHLTYPSIFHPLKHCECLCTRVRWHHLIFALTGQETCGDIFRLTAVTLYFAPHRVAVAALAVSIICHPPDCCADTAKHDGHFSLNSFLIKGQCSSTLPGQICGCDNLQAAVPRN